MLNDALNGKIHNINLSSGSIEPEEIPEETYRKYLGGYGLGARLLFDRIPQGADALGPDNVLGFFPGLLTGTPLFGEPLAPGGVDALADHHEGTIGAEAYLAPG